MAKKTFLVDSVKEGNAETNANSVFLKLRIYTETPLGRMVAESYSVKAQKFEDEAKNVKVGQEIELDMNMFDIVEHTGKRLNTTTGSVDEITVSWLHIKKVKA